MNWDPVEREVEAALAGLNPVAPTLDRDRLMFEAGKREGMKLARRGANGWRFMSGALAAGLLVSISLHSLRWQDKEQPTPGMRVVAATQKSETPEPAPVTTAHEAVLVLGGNEGILSEPALPAASYGAMRRRWQAGDDAWLESRQPVRGVNPRVRDAESVIGGARSGLIGTDAARGGRL